MMGTEADSDGWLLTGAAPVLERLKQAIVSEPPGRFLVVVLEKIDVAICY
jgi:hypothetical protein